MSLLNYFCLVAHKLVGDFGFLLLAEMTNCRRFNEKVARKAFHFFFKLLCVHACVHNEELQHGLRFG